MHFKQQSLFSWVSATLALIFFAVSPVLAQPVPLGTAESFAVLGGSTVTNAGPTQVIGNLGVSPGSAVTGFPPGIVTGTIHINNAVAAQAQSDTTTAYNTLATRPCGTNLTGQDLGGRTLTPGVYCFNSSAQLTGILTLDAQGDPNANFIFQVGSTLTTASASSVLVINGGRNCNVFWQIGSSATFGTGTSFVGNVIALSSITLTTGSNLSGRALARNGAVTLDTNSVAVCAPAQCAAVTVSPLTLPNGALLTPYNQTVSATGGTAPYAFTITNGMLPNGLLLNPATGVISGTPTLAGSFTFTVTAIDANNCRGTRQYTIVIAGVCPVITVNPLTLPNGALQTPYNQTISATGGTAPYTFALSQGTLPNGLLFNPATGMITGTPTIAGSFTFTITATDVNNCQGSRQYTIVIAGVCPVVTVNPLTLPNGALQTPYNQTITATGGTAPYVLALTQGTLPNGLLFNPASGMITGTPTVAGSFTFTISATDANNCPGSRQYTIVIAGVCPVVTVNPLTLPNGALQTPYNQTISATGGTAPYTLALTQGTLPNGLLFNAATGTITGTPTTAGSFTFTISATDANNCPGSRQYTIVIAAACPVITVNPLTLANGTLQTPYSQTITATGGTAPYRFTVPSGTLPVGLSLNVNTGVISGTPTAAAQSTFTITATDANNCVGTRGFTLQFSAAAVVTAIPTLSQWGLILMALLMAAICWPVLAQRAAP